MSTFEELEPREKELLLSAPALISLLAANEDGKMDEGEKKRAIELSHIKTFSSPIEVRDFYIEAEKDFMKRVDELDRALPKDKDIREKELRKKLSEVNKVMKKLNEAFSNKLRDSLDSYTEHVAKSHFNVLPHILDPFYWLG
jgi:hypothetical protein